MSTIVTTSDDIRGILHPMILDAVHAAVSSLTPPTPQAPTGTDLLTRGEVLSMLRITAPTLRNITRKGRLRPVRIGKKLLFRAADIAAYINGGGMA